MRIFTERWAAPRLRARALSAYQRLATYMVISMPNRNSVACGVSHFMKLLQMKFYDPILLRPRLGKYRRRHEIRLVIFMSPLDRPAAPDPQWPCCAGRCLNSRMQTTMNTSRTLEAV
jgi:hypothetical protein